MTKETIHSDAPRNEPDLTFDLEQDNDLLAALEQAFPEQDLLPHQAPTVEKRSVGIDTFDLPSCCQYATSLRIQAASSVRVSSVGVDTSDLANHEKPFESGLETAITISTTALVIANPPTPIMTPPITPVDTGDGKALIAVKNVLPFPDLGPDCIPTSTIANEIIGSNKVGENIASSSISVNVDPIEYGDVLSPATPVVHDESTKKRVAWGSPERNRIWQLPADGFFTPRPRSNLSVALLPEMNISETPKPTRELRIRHPAERTTKTSAGTSQPPSKRYRKSTSSSSPESSPATEPRQLRPRPIVPLRQPSKFAESLRSYRAGPAQSGYETDPGSRTNFQSKFAESLRSHRAGPAQSGYETDQGLRSNSQSPLAHYVKTSKPAEKNTIKKPVLAVASGQRKRKSSDVERPKAKATPKRRKSTTDIPVVTDVSKRNKKGKASGKSTLLKKKKKKLEREKIHVCETCGLAFATKAGMKTHTEAKHLGIRYKCKLCDKVAIMAPTIGAHLLKCHNTGKNQSKELILRITV